jgi:hypothetical protein
MLADDCYRLEEMNNSANVKIKMAAEQIFKEIEALPGSERERLVQRMRESADISSMRWTISTSSGSYRWKPR